MYQAIDPSATKICYISTDVDQKQPFTIGVIDCFLMAAIQDKLTTYSQNKNGLDSVSDVTLHLNMQAIEMVRFGLKAWTLQDKGVDVEMKKTLHKIPGLSDREGLTDESLMRLSNLAIKSLASQIRLFSDMTETQEKN